MSIFNEFYFNKTILAIFNIDDRDCVEFLSSTNICKNRQETVILFAILIVSLRNVKLKTICSISIHSSSFWLKILLE